MNERILSILGLCKKAGYVNLGFDPCIESIQKRNCELIVLTVDLSEKTKKRLQDRVTRMDPGIKLMSTGISSEEIERVLGKKSGIISVTNEGFAKKIKQLLNT